MGKIFCLLNNKNPAAELSCQKALFYHSDWQKKSYDDDFVSLGIFEVPQKSEKDFWYEDDNIIALMDGEINSLDCNTDAVSSTMATLVSLYKKLGANFVTYLNGQFSIVLWLKNEKKLIILNDRLGLKPLYYTQIKNKLILSSEVKSIIADSEFIKVLDTESLIDFFSYEYILGDKTLFKNIQLLSSASILEASHPNCAFKITKYWEYDFDEGRFCFNNEDGYLSRLKDIAAKTINGCINQYSNVGVGLSGGLDSRLIAALVDRKRYSLHTFTLGEVDSDDIKYANETSKVLKTEHNYASIKYHRLEDFIKKTVFYCDGLVSANHSWIFNIIDDMAQQVDVYLDGFIGDVLSGGNMYRFNPVGDYSTLYLRFDRFEKKLRTAVFSGDMYKEIIKGEERFISLCHDTHIKKGADYLDYLSLTQRQRRLINYRLVIVNNYLPARLPFADNDFIDFFTGIPKSLKLNQWLYKKIFIKYFPGLARIPQANKETIALNATKFEKIIYKGAKGIKNRLFKNNLAKTERRTWDYNKYYRNQLRKFVSSTLLTKELKDRNIFNYKNVKRLINAHFNNLSNYEKQIGILLTFELWNQQFFDKN